MNLRLGNILYGVGLVGAALAVLYSIDLIWVHQTGRSLTLASGRHVSREEMLAGTAIGVAAALLCWGAGAGARSLVRRAVEKRRAPKQSAPARRGRAAGR